MKHFPLSLAYFQPYGIKKNYIYIYIYIYILATHTLARPVQTMLLYARSCHRTLSSVSGKHRATSYTVTFRSATAIFRLLCTADKDQVRRAGLLLRRPSTWNTLSRHIRETVDSASFRKLLKMHYFTSAFGVV